MRGVLGVIIVLIGFTLAYYVLSGKVLPTTGTTSVSGPSVPGKATTAGPGPTHHGGPPTNGQYTPLGNIPTMANLDILAHQGEM